MLTLHHGWRSSASRRVRLCLAEKGLSYESRLVDMVKGEQHSPEYLAMNPNGVVPALVLDDGRVLYESSVIAEYLDEVYPQSPILPDDPYDRATVRNFVRWIDEKCLPKIIVFNWSESMQPVASQWTEQELAARLARIPTKERRDAWLRVARNPYSDQEKADAMSGLLALFQRMGEMLDRADADWLVGQRFSLADIAAIPFVMRLSELVPEELVARPQIVAWWNRVRDRPSFSMARIAPYSAPRYVEDNWGQA